MERYQPPPIGGSSHGIKPDVPGRKAHSEFTQTVPDKSQPRPAPRLGIIFCGCGLPGAAHAQPNKPARLPVTVNGKRVKTIDVHSHCLFHEAAALLGDEAATLTPPINNSQEAYLVIEQRLKAMDAQAIDMEVLSINPFWYGKDRDLAEKIVTIQNEKLAELVASPIGIVSPPSRR